MLNNFERDGKHEQLATLTYYSRCKQYLYARKN